MDFTTEDLMELKSRAELKGSFTVSEIHTLCDGYAPERAGQIIGLKKQIEATEQLLRDERSLHMDKNEKIIQLEERVRLITDRLQEVLECGEICQKCLSGT